MRAAVAAPEPQTMRCLEIRGGTEAVEQSLDLPGLQAFIYSRPHGGDARGGDVHYVSVCGGGATVRAVVADVSGHGDSVAEFSGVLRALVRKHIARHDQTSLVEALNREFGARAELSRFATAVVATFLPGSHRLTVSNAAHPRPLYYKADPGEWMILAPETAAAAGANLPLGVLDDAPYEQFAVTMAPGDVVVLYTDALTEAADPSGLMLGESGLLEMARHLDPSEARRLGPGLLEAARLFRDGRPAEDDETLVVLRHDGTGTRFPGPLQFPLVMAKMFGLVRV
ncbi:PP2C family protein-serine/threonine phosphatase [Tautonia plasticadhaerens]|uniref:Phosphoserine phosphatase RsbU n=1 Tax=Tautonia plasticadhaerens TaxID=2527974 RepID=A0A518HDF4_9BACT|nr:PP2C family protein-serine/threonine phosphatase [Tautonia plasticadhaerens]QDV38870.1 Phosphoserine phosphatase RsbU [Tautonia plasticadhaerens]